MDQMVAFSRLIAIATGRSVVRAGNAGVTLALDPEGREVARLVVDGRDRHVPGILCVGVPVPLAGESGALTPFARFAGAWFALFLLGPPLIAVAASRNRRNRSSWRG
jgi:apolipoprotein N-acyltransferase